MRKAPWLVLLCAGTLAAADDFYSRLDVSRLREVAALNEGRRKPLDSLARERVEFVSGRESIEGQDPVVTFLSMALEPSRWTDTPCIQVRDAAVASALGIQRDGADGKTAAKWVSLREWMKANEDGVLVRRVRELEKDTSREGRERRIRFEEKAADVQARATELTRMPELLLLVPLGTTKERPWLTLAEAAQVEGRWSGRLRDLNGRLTAAFAARDAKAANAAMNELADVLPTVNPQEYPSRGRLDLETQVNHLRPMRIAWAIYLAVAVLGFLRLGVRTKGLMALVMCGAGAGLLFNLSWVVSRGVLAGRWPLGNFFEVMAMAGFVISFTSLVLSAIYRTSYFVSAGTLLSATVLIIAEFALPLEYRILSPLVPVLRSYWLQYHVTCMACAYSGGTLAFGVSLLYMARATFGSPHPMDLEKLETYIYRTVQVAFVFFTAGIMLGALWANESWGRYWGWDPKEIWALICWLIYAVYLHGRMIGWCRGKWAALACIIGFGAVVFTFVGVNFWLKGLHSYAN